MDKLHLTLVLVEVVVVLKEGDIGAHQVELVVVMVEPTVAVLVVGVEMPSLIKEVVVEAEVQNLT